MQLEVMRKVTNVARIICAFARQRLDILAIFFLRARPPIPQPLFEHFHRIQIFTVTVQVLAPFFVCFLCHPVAMTPLFRQLPRHSSRHKSHEKTRFFK